MIDNTRNTKRQWKSDKYSEMKRDRQCYFVGGEEKPSRGQC